MKLELHVTSSGKMKSAVNKIEVQIKLEDIPMIFHCTELNLFQCNVSKVVYKMKCEFYYLTSHYVRIFGFLQKWCY
jgi:hypothetical protein